MCSVFAGTLRASGPMRMLMRMASRRGRTVVAGKRAVNVSVRAELVAEARAAGLNLSRTLEAALEARLAERRAAEWLARNREAIEAYNEHVERDGVFSDGLRSF